MHLRATPSPIHAVLIGIDAYLPPCRPGCPAYVPLSGAVRDVRRVETFLRDHLGVPSGRIRTFTATPDGGFDPIEPPARRPTHANLLRALRALIGRVRPGDSVWIHFAGHGGWASTTLPEAKGSRGVDHCLVPYDIGVPGASYLRDHEVAWVIHRLANRGAFTFLVLDTGAMRGEILREVGVPGLASRGTEEIDFSWSRPESPLASAPQLAAAWGAWQKMRGFSPETLAARGYVLLSACRPLQPAWEGPLAEGQSVGALTHHLLEELTRGERGLSFRDLYIRLLRRMGIGFPPQEPTLEGAIDRPVPGLARGSGPTPAQRLSEEVPAPLRARSSHLARRR